MELFYEAKFCHGGLRGFPLAQGLACPEVVFVCRSRSKRRDYAAPGKGGTASLIATVFLLWASWVLSLSPTNAECCCKWLGCSVGIWEGNDGRV